MRQEIEHMLSNVYDSLGEVDRAIQTNRTDVLWKMNPSIQSMFDSLSEGVELARVNDIDWDDWAALLWAKHEVADYCHAAAAKLGSVAYD